MFRSLTGLVCTGLVLIVLLVVTFASRAVGAPSDLNPVRFNPHPEGTPVLLVAEAEALGHICVMVPETRVLRQAVKELQECISLTTGAQLLVLRSEIREPAIVIGDCPAAARAGLSGRDMPTEGFQIKTAGNRVYIVGHDQGIPGLPKAVSNGTAWGIFEFLERFVGVRWYYPAARGGRSVVKTPSLIIPPVWIEDEPVFRKRQIYPPCGRPSNGTGERLTPLHNCLRAGNSWPVELVVHSPHWDRVPEYVDQRPELFQRRADGSRNAKMICYGHPATLEVYVENIARHFDMSEKAHMGIRGNAITVSPNDAAVACKCEHCLKLWDPDGGQYGTASRIMADFTARLAREVKKRWPDKTVIYLPYQNYTMAPGGITFPGNVEIQICGMPGLAQYKEPAIRESEQANIDRWFVASKRKVQNWHYSCWPADKTKAPYQYPHVLQRFYQENRDKLVGTFINGVKDHWPRQHVSLYCWMKLLWSPDFDVDAAIDAYCQRMYGPAAATMKELVTLQTTRWEQSRWPNGRMSPKAIYEQCFPRPVYDRMFALLAQARSEAADTAEAAAHVAYYAKPFQAFQTEFEAVVEGKGAHALTALKAADDPLIDGRLDDSAWGNAPITHLHVNKGGKEAKPRYATDVKMVWTLTGVTLGLVNHEPSPTTLVRNLHSRDDSMAWWDDNIELFFDVTGTKEGEYYQFIINPNGAISDFERRIRLDSVTCLPRG
ncbi:MAG: DUF4838 domain-containing protein, partial [Lentisphaerae bacterium]|nr:DUF4838 domain-containing protein [Lentisphaerota bacterium]